MTASEIAKEKQALGIIENLKKRNINGYYAETAEKCAKLVLSLIKEGSSVTWGGSESIKECKIPEMLSESGKYAVLDRSKADPGNMKAFYKEALFADCFLMSTNAITLDGEMMNIDGFGNRVASLIFGPDRVIIVAGMNKVVSDIDAAYDRIRNMASPPNTVRLQKNTPCARNGKCGNCMGEDCICNQIVVTRRSRDKDRIHVVLVGESLGY